MWTKLGDEYSDATRDLSDAAFRTHTEALCWSNRRGLDLLIPKRDLKRFAETDDPEQATKELAEAGWWQDSGDGWFIGCRFAEWQIESAVVERRRQLDADRQRRHRMHKVGDHRLCLPGKCSEVTRDETPDMTRDPGRDGTGRVGETRQEALEEEGSGEQGHACDYCTSTNTQQFGAYWLCRGHAGVRWEETERV